MPPRYGKELAKGTLVPTPKGFQKHGDLKPGDFVFHPSGKPIKVLANIPQPEPASLRVTFTDGASVVVHPNHEWTVKDRRHPDKKTRTIETKEMLGDVWIGPKGRRGSRARFLVPFTAPVQFTSREVPIDPYFLGVWLGNGSTSDTRMVTFNPETFEEMLELIPYKPTWIYWHKTHHVPRARFADAPKHDFGKTIPDEYLFNSERVRRSLLAGLIDTDGHVDGMTGRVRFVNTERLLVERTGILVRSLGFRTSITSVPPSLSSSGIQGRKRVYTLAFNIHDGTQVARLAYKRIRTQSKRRQRGIMSILKVASEPGNCIQVDSSDGLYLVTEHFIPTHNSQLASINFPAWYLGRHPEKHIITASYSSELSQDFGGKTRDLLNGDEYKAIFDTTLREDSQSKAKWETQEGGYYISVGVGGAITGRGADILLIDDPFKNRQDAESQVYRENVWDWFTSTAYTRLEPQGSIVLIMTRWHRDDLAGRLIQQMEDGGEIWDIVMLPGIATCEEDYRKEGDALWPDRYSKEDLENIKATIGIRDWSSLYQQSPVLVESQEFTQDMFRYFEESDLIGKNLNYKISVDLAISKNEEADRTAIVVRAKDPQKPEWYIMETVVGRLDPLQTIDAIFSLYQVYRVKGPVVVGIETVAYQKALLYFLQEEMRRRQTFIHIIELQAKGKKEERIRGLIPLYKTGVVFHRHSQKEMEEELQTFPYGLHDDIIDALAYQAQFADNTAMRSKRTQPQRDYNPVTGY